MSSTTPDLPLLERVADPPSLVQMRRAATGLLVAMTALYIGVHVFGGVHQGWGYVQAFAEAAMVGGLADWFAVTAIFRRPFGLPIPHTAVIPKNQGRIADALGAFIAENFLAPALVAERVAKQDMAMALGRWLSDRDQVQRVADGLVGAIPAILDTLDDETVAEFLRKQASSPMAAQQVAPAIGNMLEALAAQGKHQVLLDAALAEGWKWLEENQETIRARVRDRTGWLWRMLSVDAQASGAMIGAMEDLIVETARDPHHPLRKRVTDILARFAGELKNDPVMHARIATMTSEVLSHPAVSEALDAAWAHLKEALRKDLAKADSQIRAWAVEGLRRLGEGLTEDVVVRDALNDRLRALVVELAARHGQDVSRLVSDTIRAWDADTVVQKLEQNVGRDLQFIRLNGTVIGGLVGLVLHAGGVFFPMLG
ncbi:MAG: hypothetical protein FD124_1579 [Alphaproteobacteria bacterium]|nr:MAG: hypothetical protein FD160_1922 [Caulobacteraceae bacterium]TPW06779.1 MAG: hypothetical protein FD124_1579 [Alphaproteobacteria bacterium]